MNYRRSKTETVSKRWTYLQKTCWPTFCQYVACVKMLYYNWKVAQPTEMRHMNQEKIFISLVLLVKGMTERRNHTTGEQIDREGYADHQHGYMCLYFSRKLQPWAENCHLLMSCDWMQATPHRKVTASSVKDCRRNRNCYCCTKSFSGKMLNEQTFGQVSYSIHILFSKYSTSECVSLSKIKLKPGNETHSNIFI